MNRRVALILLSLVAPHAAAGGKRELDPASDKAYGQPSLQDLVAELNKALAAPPRPMTPTELAGGR